jgi:hypothetical protein
MKLQKVLTNNSVVFFVELDGTKIIVLEARVTSQYDLNRLQSLAEEHLGEIVVSMRKAA